VISVWCNMHVERGISSKLRSLISLYKSQ
jgi:hypothetical protein